VSKKFRSYAVDLNVLDMAKHTFHPKITNFLDGMVDTITTAMPDYNFGAYSGYAESAFYFYLQSVILLTFPSLAPRLTRLDIGAITTLACWS
jgi:hypothetical protein